MFLRFRILLIILKIMHFLKLIDDEVYEFLAYALAFSEKV